MHSLLLLALLGGAAAAAPTATWVDPPQEYAGICHKMSGIYEVKLCLTERAYGVPGSNRAMEYNHVANVLAQVMDNNQNGVVDDEAVQNRLRDDNSVLYIDARCADSNYGADLVSQWMQDKKPAGRYQLVCLEDVHPNSCDIPDNRGGLIKPDGAAARKNSWGATEVRKATTATAGCSNVRDQTFEKVLSLVSKAAGKVHSSRWAVLTGGSTLDTALTAANGDCGMGHANTYKDPHSDKCTGHFAIYDAMCRACDGCTRAKGLYYALATYLGGLYTETRFEDVKGEWTMTVPDTDMPEAGAGSQTLQTKVKSLWDLVNPTAGNAADAWLPRQLPNGKYTQLAGDNKFNPAATKLSDLVTVKAAQPEDVDDDKDCPLPPPTPSDDSVDVGKIILIIVIIIIVGLLILCAYACCEASKQQKNEPTA
eukprot:TRINITY_DN1132_c0_g3_i1.p1 TRINITY_DN1132_c0_g3~~TRINITY_DN1132_c0_g3_i1.p1  ORF type:complete len:424 (+),score=179.40 TRINITY_DN1132_c0_g3_i1:52-1323(+)